MSISTRASALAITVESTEGTPVEPSAGSEFIALQDDFAMEGLQDELENAERLNSLGSAKGDKGQENPTVSMSHYWRGSGVEGQAPNYAPLIKAAFGSETAVATERDTVAGSTTTTVEVDAGEGTEFPLGRALLIKDGTNGRTVRFSTGASADTVGLGFNLDTAPAAGVNLGKPVYWSPANEGHPTLNFWHYIGNSSTGAIETMAGARISSFTLSADANNYINISYSAEGTGYYFDPITVAATDRYLDFTSDNGTFAALIAAKTYKDPHELASALQTAMNDADPLETFTVSYGNTTGKFTIASSTSTVLELLWNTGTNAANTVGDKIGFATGADDTGATSYESDNAQDYSSPVTPSYDSADPLVAKSNEVMIGDADDNVCFSATSVSISMNTPVKAITDMCADSGKSGSVINAREVTIEVSGYLDSFDADKARRFRENSDTRFQWVAGQKTGGNWQEGKTVAAYAHTAVMSSAPVISDDEGIAAVSFSLKTYVNASGDGEFFMAQL